MSRIVYLFLPILLCIYLFVNPVFAQSVKQVGAVVDSAEAEKWREDLRYMAAEMPKRHKNLFHTMSREQFESAVNSLNERIPRLARHQIIVELARIVAMVGDGHTNVAPTRDPKIGFRALPVKLYLFKDGLFVRAASREHADLVGARVVKIGDSSVEQAIARAREIVGRDNEMDVKFFAPLLLSMPEALHALGLADDTESVAFVIERQGKEQTISLKPYGPAEMMPPDTDLSWMTKSGWIDLRDGATTPLPLWLTDPQNKFWFEYVPGTRSLYVQVNEVGDKETETLAEFSQRLFAFVDANPVEKLILDLRLNRGGNGFLLRPLVTGIIRSRKVDQPGKLFAIIGRSTWSAAQFLLNDLEKYTNTIFVGEPSGSKGNAFGDSRKITLPNSGLTVRVSIYWWQDWHPLDTRQWTAPHLTAEMTSDDYRANNDPALKTILNYTPKPSLKEMMEEALAKNDLALAVKSFRQFRADPLNLYYNTEEALLSVGYQLLKTDKLDAAIEIFKLSADANPQSADSYELLGDAYAKRGNTELAITSYEKSLELDPRDTDVVESLKRLKSKQDKP
ncbi:MAG: tetratricopeptide repeat protein [Pyrinomonadaceae bacterium]